MDKGGPIIIIEDDADDREILTEIFSGMDGLENEIIFFTNGEDALAFLIDLPRTPFLILSDINMPKLSGFELRDKIYNNEQLRTKCIPYLFFTTTSEQNAVIEAYSKSIQGFFVKPVSVQTLTKMLKSIIEYWKHCHSPKITYNQ